MNSEQLPQTKEEFLKLYDSLKESFTNMKPELEVTVRDPDMDVEGFVVVWNTKISHGGPLHGCGKGGTRIKDGLTLDEIKRLSCSMAEKNAAAGLPLGGAKSGLNADPKADDYEQKYRRFAKLCEPYLRENGGIFGGFGYDIGGIPPKNAIWACDELGTLGSFTGKPVDMGGTDYDKEGIAGLGVAVAGHTLLSINNIETGNATFAVQGLGAMGAAVVRYFSEYGGKLKALADPVYGGSWLFNDVASDEMIDAISSQDRTTVSGLLEKEASLIADNSQDALYAEVDIIFPCAIEDVLTKDNAAKVKAKFVSEGANNPTTDEAHQILFDNGVMVVPDIIANPGGIIAAFVELSSSVSAEENAKTRAKVTEAKDMTRGKVAENVAELFDLVRELGVRPDLIGDYMAWRNIIHGLPQSKQMRAA